MREVTVGRVLNSPPATIRDAMADLGPFMEAAGFDRVDVDDDRVRVANRVGLVTIELTLAVVEAADADLVYEQRDGIFEAMRTEYVVTPVQSGTDVTATTEFALDVALVGDVLDATIIRRQRRAELTAQLDWLETVRTD